MLLDLLRPCNAFSTVLYRNGINQFSQDTSHTVVFGYRTFELFTVKKNTSVSYHDIAPLSFTCRVILVI